MASPPLIKNGISYVPAKAAAPGAGISADYITKLCRKGEVNAVVVGTTWYVDEASLADFVARTKAAKRAQAELNAQQLKEVARRAQAAEQQPQQQPSISLAQQLRSDKAARAAAFAHRQAKYRLPRPNAIALATITLLVATSASALGSDTLRAHMATAAQLPHRLAAAAATAAASATSLAQQLPALSLPQLPSAKPAQLAQAQTSLAQTLTQKIRNFFCRFITGCTTGSLAAGTPPTRANSATTSRKLDESASNIGYPHDATKSENVNPAASSPAQSTPQTSPSDIARSAPTTPVVGSSASASASPSAVAFETKPPPQPDTVAAKLLAQNPGNATSPLIQYVTVGGITQQLLESRLAQLESVLSARIQSASLASAYQSTRSSDNVGDNLRNLTDGYALAFDTNALSADAATLGALTVTSNASVGGDLSLASLPNAILGTDASGTVIATSTLAAGSLSLPTGFTLRGSALNAAEATSTLFIDDSGNIGIGTTTPISRLTINARDSATANTLVMTTVATGNSIVGRRSTGTLEIPTAISASGANALVLTGQGFGDTDYKEVGGIFIQSGEAVSDAQAGGQILFTTTQAGTLTRTNRLIIRSDGRSDFFMPTTSPDFFAQLSLRSQRTAIVTGNLLGGLGFRSDDTNLASGGTTTAGIQAFAAQTHTAAALGTDLRFSVTADNTTVPFEALRITSSGNARFTSFVDASHFTATSTQATSTFAGGISALGPAQFANSANFFATTAFGATGTTTIATDGTIQTPSVSAQFFAATSPTATSTFAGALTVDGKVGIGTTSPATKLQVLTESSPDGLLIQRNNNGTGEYASLYFGVSAVAGGKGGILFERTASNGRGTLHLATTNDTTPGAFLTPADARLSITSTGNLGIASTSPGSLLSLGTSNGINFSLATSTFNSTGGINLASGCFALQGNCLSLGSLGLAGTQGQVAYFNGTNTAVGTSSLFIATNGRVGVGTTSPNYKLEVNGAIATGGNAANGALNILSTSGNLRGSLFTDGTDLALAASGGSTNLLFRTQATTRMTIDTSGLVGIGTTTPWRTLSVTGTVGFDGLTGATGAGSLCLDANKQVVYNSASDSCLSSTRDTKTDINPLVTDALEQVLALNPVSFKYKQGDARTRYGFIAEDAADVDPHLATYDAEANISGIDDRAILAIIVSAIKQLATQLTDLAATVTSFAESFTTRELTFQRAVGESLTLTRELCIADGAADTSPLCLTKSQVAALLSQIGSAASAISGASSPSKIPTPPAQNDDEDAPEIQDQSVQNPSPTGDPDLTDSAQPDNANWTPDQQPSIDNTSHATDGNPSPSPSPAASATSPAPTTETAPEPSSNTPAAAANDNLAPPASEAI